MKTYEISGDFKTFTIQASNTVEARKLALEILGDQYRERGGYCVCLVGG